jgi:hypothetical protein
MLKLPEIAPIVIRAVPSMDPFILSTYGRERTPDPIAVALKANILPLTVPRYLCPKAISMKVNFLLS